MTAFWWYTTAMRTPALVAVAVAAATATAAIAVAVAVAGPPPSDLAKVVIKPTKLTDSVYLLEGAGGNIGLSVGKDGGVLIDDQFAPLTAKITAASRKLGANKIKFVLNTHLHGDHTGGNENLGKAGVVILAHDNVRKRMSVEQFNEAMGSKVPPAPPAALPVVTFTTDVTFHLNGDDIHVFHVDPAHTDGDSIVHFTKANVVHMGDTFMTISYPFVDTSSGGTFAGFIAAADKVLAMSDASTKIIPGHGVVTDKAGLQAWRDMLATLRDRVAKQVAAGKTLEQVQAAKLTAEWDDRYGQKFIKPDQIVAVVYNELKTKR